MSSSAHAPLSRPGGLGPQAPHGGPPNAPRHLLRCRCGSFRAVLRPPRGTRSVCYCKDCQAFAHYLGLPEGMLDEAGGTAIVAVRPRHVVVVAGAEQLVCMSLSGRGMLRWYTACCHTPIGNTPRSMSQHHVGLVHTCLEGGSTELAASFGPVKLCLNRQSAIAAPGRAPIAPLPASVQVAALLRFVAALLWARLSGRYKFNPFFDARTGAPVAKPRVLTTEEHDSLARAVAQAAQAGATHGGA